MSTQTKGVKNKNPGVHGISKYLLRSGSTSESSVLAQNKSRSEETRSNMAASTTSGKSSESVEKVNSGQGDETVTNVDLKKCIVEMINGLENKLTERMGTMEESIKAVTSSIGVLRTDVEKMRTDIDAVEESIQFHSNKVEELEKLVVSKEAHEALLDRVKELERQIQYNEYRSRKYNVLIYGVPKSEDEDTDLTVRSVLKEKLKMSKEYVDALMIANTHRIPKNPESTYKPAAPEAIIIKLVKFDDRNRILEAGKNLKKGSKMAVRTDLPQPLKKHRAELSRIAYVVRKDKKWQTQIRESVNAVWLMVRKNRADTWTKLTGSPDDLEPNESS